MPGRTWETLDRTQQLRLLSRSSTFRISVIYAALILLSVSVMFEAVTWSVNRVARQQIDHDISEEAQEVLIDAGARTLPALTHAVAAFVAGSPDIYYSVQDDRGVVLAGNMASLAPIAGWRLLHPAPGRQVRGLGQAVPGGYLFVGFKDIESSRLGHAISRAFLVGITATVLLALGAGLLISLLVLRRMEAISRASRAIMAGDLGRRIPLRGTNDEFDQLAAVLNQMLDRIQGLMANLQQVTSDIAHDLRTPLTRMRQRLERATQRHGSADSLRDTLSASINEVDAILSTFSALLRIAQIEAGSRRAGFAPLDLPGLVDELVESYQPVAEESGQSLPLAPAVARGPPPILGDRPLLVQLLSNLIENAIRHTPAGCTITARARVIGGAWAIVVADDGPGIPPEKRAAVLTRFVRLETSRSTPGNGLGLALVAAIAGLHGARLALEDNAPGLRVVVGFAPAQL